MNLVRTLSAFALSSVVLGTGALLAQKPAPGTTKDDDDVVKAGPKDPFTGGDEKAMAALGIVSYGPLAWADGLRTTDVEKVLGEGRILWVETAHFRIGCNLGTTTPGSEPEPRKQVNAELQRLHKKCGKIPERASKLEPWLRVHLYAQRCEDLYKDFAKLVGHDDASKTFLGQPDKFPVLLFQKKSDLARYIDRFCGRKSTTSQRHYYGKSRVNGVICTAEGEDFFDEPSVHSNFRFNLVQAFQDARGGAPYWLSVGLAHWYERQIPSNVITCRINDDESVDVHTQHEWNAKMRARATRESLCTPFLDLCVTKDTGYYANVQAWSRVDYLITTDRAKFGEFMIGMKGSFAAAMQEQLLQQVYGMDAPTFDTKWRQWVVKTYK